MPWLEPDPSGSFHIAFRYLGRRYRRSLKTKDAREAELLAARVEDNLRLIERGRIVVPDDVDIAAFLLSDCRLTAPSTSRPTLETLNELFETYFERMGVDKLERSTLQGMKIHRAHLERLMGKQKSLRSLNAEALQGYIDKRSTAKVRGKHALSPATTKKEIVTLRTVWNWAWRLELVAKPYPGKRLCYPKIESKLPFRTVGEIEERIARGGVTKEYASQMWESAYLSVSELAELLEHVKQNASEPYAYLLFVFAAHTGARRSEILRSEVDDFDFHSGTVSIRERKRVRGVRSTRSVPMSSTLEAASKEWLRLHPGGMHMFPDLVSGPHRGKPSQAGIHLRVDLAHDIFKRTLKTSRWDKLAGYHLLRHTFCSTLAASGIDQRVIDAFVGHLSLDTVRRYRHLLPRQARHSIDSVFG